MLENGAKVKETLLPGTWCEMAHKRAPAEGENLVALWHSPALTADKAAGLEPLLVLSVPGSAP